ncbi:MAG: putative pre6S rRNA nuclease [Clostridiales bacterium]|jgi:putative Holliday junction resolvase|nr:putative pre6S rRNA nuclease [Clostridiales bacterium]MDN5281349.1 putative pre6S rRNA nuclease [Candidatus Ozemobacter sp.]
MKIMALDVGNKRIGVATCDRLEIAATPHSVIKAGKNAVNEVLKIIEQDGVEAIVIGLPTSFDGVERESCARARFFKNELAAKTQLEIEFYDERLTSKIAEASLIEGGMRREERKAHIDAVAASVILQGYLDNRRQKGISPTK